MAHYPVDQNDPVWKLADAALKSSGDPDAIERAIRELKPSARDIARAYTLCLGTPPFSSTAAPLLILERRLQVALVEEHVAAQQRMGGTINKLTWVLVALTVVLVFIEVWPKLLGCR